jgi:hypothetical protein
VPAPFLPGLELSRLLYTEVASPLLAGAWPGLRYSAALIGPGSEVLGFDTARSTDHDWGPRLQVFLPAGQGGLAGPVTDLLAARLPATFRGWPTAFESSAGTPGVRPRVLVAELGAWLHGALGFDPRRGVTLLDWLSAATQRLAEVTSGAVFHDGLAAGSGPAPGPGSAGPGGLAAARAALGWYPPDVWRYVLACEWERIGEDEAFPGRSAEAGDDLGSVVITARLARHLMRLCLLMHRRYPPYAKWLGRAFAAVDRTGIGSSLRAALAAPGWPGRERHLSAAYEATARLHNSLGLTPPLDPAVRPYFSRPFLVPGAGRFAAALQAGIRDPAVAALPGTGAADQVLDGVAALGDQAWVRSVLAARLARPPGGTSARPADQPSADRPPPPSPARPGPGIRSRPDQRSSPCPHPVTGPAWPGG